MTLDLKCFVFFILKIFHVGKEQIILSSSYDPKGFPLSAKYCNAFIVLLLKRFVSKIKTEVKVRTISSEKHPAISKE